MVQDLKSWSSQQVRSLSDSGLRQSSTVFPGGLSAAAPGGGNSRLGRSDMNATTMIMDTSNVGNPSVVRRVVRKVVKGVPSPVGSYNSTAASSASANVYTPSSNTTTTAGGGMACTASQSPSRGGWSPKHSNNAAAAFTVMGSSISNFPPVSPALPGRDCLGYMAANGGGLGRSFSSSSRATGLATSASTIHLVSRPSSMHAGACKSCEEGKPGRGPTLDSSLPAYGPTRGSEGGLNRPPIIRVVRSFTGERSSSASPVNRVELGADSFVGDDASPDRGRAADVTRFEPSDDSCTTRVDSAVRNGSCMGDEDDDGIGVDGEPLDDDDEVDDHQEEAEDSEKAEEPVCSTLSPVKEAAVGGRNSMEVPVAIALKWLLSTAKEEVEEWTLDLTDVGLRNVLEVVASHVRKKGRHLEEVEKEIKDAKGCDAFAFFGLDENCDIAELKKAYKEKSRELHPDKGGDEEAFVDMKAKYEDILQNADNAGDEEKSQQKGSIGWDPAERESMIKALFELRHQVILIERKIDNLTEELKRVKIRKGTSNRMKDMLPPMAECVEEESIAS